MTGDALILFFLKTPEKGAVKSRLAAVLGEDAALELYRSFVLDMLETLPLILPFGSKEPFFFDSL